MGLCLCCSALSAAWGGQSCPAVKVQAPLSPWSAWECCEEVGNVSIAPQGQSHLSHTMEGWAGPEKAEGWITAWSSALELPQPPPHKHCCCCRHPVIISQPSTSLCPPTAGFHIAPCWAPSPGEERISLRSWSTCVGVVWTPVKEEQQEQGHPSLSQQAGNKAACTSCARSIHDVGLPSSA